MTETAGTLRHAATVPATSANLGPGFDAFGLALRGPGADGTHTELAVRSLPRSEQTERVVTAGDGAGEVATGDDNLIWRSLVRFCEHHGAPVPDVALRADNSIPLERGLGSSSAAIVAGLVLARALTGLVVSDPDLLVLADAIEGHPDNVAPALLGGLVACAGGDDDRLVVRRVNPAAALRPLVLVPSTRQATTSARAVLPETLSRDEVATQAARATHVFGALSGVWPASVPATVDLLHEPARFAAMPASGALVHALRSAGVHAWLSGAGPTVAAVPGAPWATDGEVAKVAAEHGFTAHELRVDLAGAVVCAAGRCGIAGAGDCVRCPQRRV